MERERIKADAVARELALDALRSGVWFVTMLVFAWSVFELFESAGEHAKGAPISSFGALPMDGLVAVCCGLIFAMVLIAVLTAFFIRSAYLDLGRKVKRLRRRVDELRSGL
ncbi:hypothetical protein FAZ69_23340 [Trinickia terrae]|uniref:Uncharacterized protein n=1 Tax=Trinickia terrae TaxID=2571161 RepID=A0A4U1HKB2_9BURK|nr:hypothetical protein [Trinickia terrae]TKC80408.1 hypothetical protein FAZ69_29315 [Trinickia terrae]TKC83429.1 hypothetical protein FAZ69_23340 [Trinickia terrae]